MGADWLMSVAPPPQYHQFSTFRVDLNEAYPPEVGSVGIEPQDADTDPLPAQRVIVICPFPETAVLGKLRDEDEFCFTVLLTKSQIVSDDGAQVALVRPSVLDRPPELGIDRGQRLKRKHPPRRSNRSCHRHRMAPDVGADVDRDVPRP